MKVLIFLICLLPITAAAKDIIAVIDTGVDSRNAEAVAALCPGAGRDFTGAGMQDVNGHGTDVVLTIARRVDLSKFCILPLKWYHRTASTHTIPLAVSYAISQRAKVINMSIEGGGSYAYEWTAILSAIQAGAQVVVAAGNGNLDLSASCRSFPACYAFKSPRFHVVTGSQRNGLLLAKANYGGPITAIELGSLSINGHAFVGTSAATAVHSAKVANALR